MLNQVAEWLVDPSGLTPHGFCLLWEPGLIWLLAVSDASIGIAYFSIPLALAIILRRRPDLVFRPVFVLFAAFIVLCGSGHWLDLLTLWVPAYGLDGVVKAATGAVSLLTAITLWASLPRALLLPSVLQLQQVKQALAEREAQTLELSRLNVDLEQFAYIASHDLKAPLHAMAQLAGWIGEDIKATANPETLLHLQLLNQRAVRLEMLIASLLKYSRVGHADTFVEPVDVGGLVDAITASISPPSGFTVRFQGAAAVIASPRSPLEHVLRNLISNAVAHHDRPTGEIIVSARDIEGMTEFRVDDDGPGIAAEYHRRIFLIFQTLKRRDDYETSGVGLSIVQKTVDRAGGKVWIESAPPRRGTAFVFTWPGTCVRSAA